MAFILVSTGDTYTADLANQVVQALSGVADKGQPISLTTLDDATNYALTVRNLDTTNGRALRVLDSAGNELLHVDDDGTYFAKSVALASDATVDGIDLSKQVPAFLGRQGSSATNWSASGATSYTPTKVRLQCGVVTTDGDGEATVTFPTAFSATPIVTLTPGCDIFSGVTTFAAGVWTVSATQMEIRTAADGTPESTDVHWLAIGPVA